MNPSRAAIFSTELEFKALPEKVITQAKRCLLDGVGAALGGTRTRTAAIAANFAHSQFADGPAMLLRSGERLSLSGATLANVTAANALDVDDGHRLTKGHPGAFIIMPALACCEALDVSGTGFIAALVAGYEVAIRAGIITHAHYSHYHASGSWGSMGTAVTSGRLLGLSVEQMDHALGLAEYHGALSPIERCLRSPAMTKDGIAWGAHAGMCAALMASDGFTGNPSVFHDADYEDIHGDFGKRWRIMELYFKPYTCCRWAQPAVDGVVSLMADAGLGAEDIQHIELRCFAEAAELSHNIPENTEQAQYNIIWPVAAAAVHGECGPAQILPPAFDDEQVQEMAGRISLVVDGALQERFPAECLNEVVIRTRNGHSHASGPVPARGDSHIPLSDDEIRHKFMGLVEPIVGKDAAGALIEAAHRIETDDGPAQLLDVLHRHLPKS